jgi:hypothetical protein
MIVELDIFSGRPNPRWELDERAADALRDLVSRLEVTSTTLPEPPGLGYRGFVVADDGEKFRAFRGYIARDGVVLGDPTASIERFLLDRLPAEVQDLRGRIVPETGPAP